MSAINNYIYIYHGPGSDPICLEETSRRLKETCSKYSVIGVDASYISREADPSLYVFPGGSALRMGCELQRSMDKIKGCVERGSGLLGLCAGAMFACSKWDYLLPTLDASRTTGISLTEDGFTLNLGPHAFGPAFFDGACASEDAFEDPKGRLANIGLSGTDESFACYWEKGPGFDRLAADTVVVAEYKPAPDINPLASKSLAAIVQSTYNRGKIVLSGIHPELATWSQSRGFSLSEKDFRSNDLLFRDCCRRTGIEVDS